MANEVKTMKPWVIRALKPIDAVSVENRVGPGTPDVNFIDGWVELKSLDTKPKRLDTTKIKIDHYTPQQRAWILKRWMKGGKVFLLLQLEKEWFLFDGMYAARHVGKVVYQELIDNAVAYWPKKPKPEELLKCFQAN